MMTTAVFFFTGPIILPGTFYQNLFLDLHQAILNTFLKKHEQMPLAEPFQSPTVNAGHPTKDTADAFIVKARFTTNNKFLTEGLEQSLEILGAAKRQAMLVV